METAMIASTDFEKVRNDSLNWPSVFRQKTGNGLQFRLCPSRSDNLGNTVELPTSTRRASLDSLLYLPGHARAPISSMREINNPEGASQAASPELISLLSGFKF